jgi:MscS family membrane protein
LEHYTEDGLDILVYFFTKTVVWGEYLQVREDINLKFLQILEEEDVDIALPARRLMVETEAEEAARERDAE